MGLDSFFKVSDLNWCDSFYNALVPKLPSVDGLDQLTEVYGIFEIIGDASDLGVCHLVALASNVELAQALCQVLVSKPREYRLCHSAMNKENNYAYVGKRDNCLDECPFGYCGGFVIEKINIKTP